jgi:hypothetical protein
VGSLGRDVKVADIDDRFPAPIVKPPYAIARTPRTISSMATMVLGLMGFSSSETAPDKKAPREIPGGSM